MNDAHVCGINKFVERDIDLLLAEEFRVNPSFSNWVLGKFGVSDSLVHPAVATDVSVVEDGSEADVVATFNTRDGKFYRLFVENKIDAVLMPDQLQRYLRRGEGEVRRGLVSGYSVLFFTPSYYRCAQLPPLVQQITFEEAAQMLQSQSDLRLSYRASLLTKALPQSTAAARDAKVVAADPYIKEWWDKVYSMLDREFPNFFVHKTFYPRSVYFAPETPGQAGYLRVDFKGHKGEVDLAFKNIAPNRLQAALTGINEFPGVVVANGKSAALQIACLEPFVISDGFDVIETKVRASYQAAHDLLSFWKRNQALFDRLVASDN